MATEKKLLPFFHVLIFLPAFFKVSVGNGAVNWTTKPEDSEYFVGSEAIFQWEYSSRSSNTVEFIKFGIKAAGEAVVIINKDMFQKVVRFNKEVKQEVTGTFKGRVTALENQTAGFKITNLRMDDSGRYFCFLEPEDQDLLTVDDYVELRVVDIIMDRKNSTVVIESWEGHKITLKCAVRKAFPNSTVRFYWSQTNQQLQGKQVDWKDMSQMTIVTEVDRQFNPVTCIAKTESSTQSLDIKIKRLHKPRKPINVTIYEIPGNKTECPMYNKVTWEPPVDDGDTPITSYLVEYKHPVFRRVLISKTISRCTEHVICKLQHSGHPRELYMDVRAINKVGRGFRSRAVPVSFFSSPSAPLNLTSSLVRNEQPPFDVWISWNPPEQNGGSAVMQYALEYKEQGAPWIDAAELKTNNTYMSISKNEKSFVYEVRVKARNKFGLGAASKVITAYFAETPDPPQDLMKGKVFYDKQNKPNIQVVWKPPKYDGGSEVMYYIVEHKTVKTEWTTAAKAAVNKTEYSFQVKKSETYTVRTRAVNKLGVGQPADVTVKVTEEDVKTLARSRSWTAPSGSLSVILLLSALSRSLT